MNLSDEQKLYIRQNYKKTSARQLAKTLKLSRLQIEDYVLTFASEQATASRWVPKVPTVFLAGFIALITFLAYSASLSYAFVWDDIIQVLKNPLLEDFSIKGLVELFRWPIGVVPGYPEYVSFSYRPVQAVSYWVDFWFWGPNPVAFHATNILFQVFSATLLFILLTRLINNKEIAFWTAAIFAIHPVQIAAVTYVSGRAESLAAVAMFISFYFFYKGLGQPKMKRALFLIPSVFFYLAAILSKELSMVLPILFLVYELVFNRSGQRKIMPAIYVAYALVAALSVWMRISVLGALGQGGIGDLALSIRVLGAFMSLSHYLRLLFFPHSLHLAYQLPAPTLTHPVVLLGIMALGVLLTLTWRSRTNHAMFFGWLWFWIFLIPVMDVLVLMNGPMAEHWLYNALIGFFMALLVFLFSLSAKPSLWFRRAVEPAVFLLVLAFAVTTHHSSRVWKDEISVFENIIKYTHRDPDIYSSLGSAYAKSQRWAEAEKAYRKAIELDPQLEHAHRGLEAVIHMRPAKDDFLTE